jgi:hypothetical protein
VLDLDDFGPAIEVTERTNSPSKIASKGQRQFGDEKRFAKLFLRGGAPKGSNYPEAGTSLYNLSKIG